jgi:hypothetical protein
MGMNIATQNGHSLMGKLDTGSAKEENKAKSLSEMPQVVKK